MTALRQWESLMRLISFLKILWLVHLMIRVAQERSWVLISLRKVLIRIFLWAHSDSLQKPLSWGMFNPWRIWGRKRLLKKLTLILLLMMNSLKFHSLEMRGSLSLLRPTSTWRELPRNKKNWVSRMRTYHSKSQLQGLIVDLSIEEERLNLFRSSKL